MKQKRLIQMLLEIIQEPQNTLYHDNKIRTHNFMLILDTFEATLKFNSETIKETYFYKHDEDNFELIKQLFKTVSENGRYS